MTDAEILVLKQSDGKEVEIRCKDGELMAVRVLLVSESERDVIYDLISSNRPERYCSGAAYSVSFDDIEAFNPRSAESI